MVAGTAEKGTMTTQMPTAERTGRRPRRGRVAIAAVVIAAMGALTAGACTPEADHTFGMVNQSRAQSGIHALEFNHMLHTKAQGWAQQLSNQGYLSHSRLADNNWGAWRKLGENVGFGYSLEGVHQAFMNSSGHRANILDRSFNKGGTGVVRDGGGRFWVVQEFMLE